MYTKTRYSARRERLLNEIADAVAQRLEEDSDIWSRIKKYGKKTLLPLALLATSPGVASAYDGGPMDPPGKLTMRATTAQDKIRPSITTTNYVQQAITDITNAQNISFRGLTFDEWYFDTDEEQCKGNGNCSWQGTPAFYPDGMAGTTLQIWMRGARAMSRNYKGVYNPRY